CSSACVPVRGRRLTDPAAPVQRSRAHRRGALRAGPRLRRPGGTGRGSSPTMEGASEARGLVADALRALDVRNLTLCIHDASFPGDPDEDVGRGAPSSRGGLRFLDFVRSLGFTGVQLGPDGMTPADEPSPYRGAAFPKQILSIALAPLAADA